MNPKIGLVAGNAVKSANITAISQWLADCRFLDLQHYGKPREYTAFDKAPLSIHILLTHLQIF